LLHASCITLTSKSKFIYGPNKAYTEFLKPEIILKIVRCTKIIINEDQQDLCDTTTDRINLYLEKYKGNDVRLCNDKDRHSEVETRDRGSESGLVTKGQSESARNTGTESQRVG